MTRLQLTWLQFQTKKYWIRLGVTGVSFLAQFATGIELSLWPSQLTLAQPLPPNSLPSEVETVTVQEIAQLTAVRILTQRSSGSGTIVRRQGQIYTVLTSWHVLAFSEEHTIVAPDGRRYRPVGQPRQLGNADMAITKFRVGTEYDRSFPQYKVAQVAARPVALGEAVYAAGFPMYRRGTLTPTFDLGLQNFRFTIGKVSLIPPKSLYQGYRLGYTNDIEVGMSGGPIFDASGFLVGINGRVKYRDPDFGVYFFEDGTEPAPAMLEEMVRSSWGIPISTYLRFISLAPGDRL